MVYPAFYNGPINYFTRLVREERITLEQYEHYSKQTYRNRFRIMGPNGIMTLSVPVKKKPGVKNLVRDIAVDYDTPWNKVHWRSLVAAYASSPFFELMRDEFFPFYEKRFRFLIDLNEGLMNTTLGFLGLGIPVDRSTQFSVEGLPGDFTGKFHAKKRVQDADPAFKPPVYHQVFAERFGFVPNLSILDLLFNAGPDAYRLMSRALRI